MTHCFRGFLLVGIVLLGATGVVFAQNAPGSAAKKPAPKAAAAKAPAVKPAAAAPAGAAKPAGAVKPAGGGQVAKAVNVAAPPAAAKSLKVDPLDWPDWRGPEQNGVSRETGLVEKWDFEGEGENLIWKNEECGGISTPIVMRGKLYTLVRDQPETSREGEKVICVDAATGKKLWENRFNVYLSDVPKERVGWSSCVGDPATGRVYALGVCGFFQCIDGDTGKTIWSHSLTEEFGLLTTYGGRTNVPVVFDDLALISGVVTNWGELARPAHRFLAFNKNTGEVVWINGTKIGPEDTTYSTPFLTVLDGQAALVFGSGDGGVYALQPRTGQKIWNFQLSRRGLNVSPVVADGKVYMAHAEENTDNTTMGGIFCIDGSKKGDVSETGKVWQSPGMVGKSSPLLVDGRVYAFDDGAKMYIVDAATGEPVGKPVKMVGTIMRGSPLYADGKIYACTTGAWHVYKITKDGVKLVNKLRLSPDDEVSGSPIASHGRIYLPTAACLYCIGQKDAKPVATAAPAPPQETPVSGDDKPAFAQLVPAEVLLTTGGAQQYTVRLFNDRGQFLKNGQATFELTGPGEIDAQGKFTAPSDPAHAATTITAKVGDLTAQARARIVPPLPWKFDFNAVKLEIPKPMGPTPPTATGKPPVPEGEPPITWIGARYRNKVREIGGENVMVKVTTIPKGTRSQSWMGPVNLHDYTVQADVRGALTNNKLPDAGVIAQRYTLDLMGASQQLQIRTWTPELKRFSKSVPLRWKPDTWYTLKFRAAVEGGKAVLKGKVWPRGEKEPEAWTIEAEDETPNVNGSPGLFGNANDSEINYDNISVTPNAKT